jgi:hypothetical protein
VSHFAVVRLTLTDELGDSGPLGYVIFAEVSSAKLRSKTVALGIWVNSLSGMVVNIVVPYLQVLLFCRPMVDLKYSPPASTQTRQILVDTLALFLAVWLLLEQSGPGTSFQKPRIAQSTSQLTSILSLAILL